MTPEQEAKLDMVLEKIERIEKLVSTAADQVMPTLEALKSSPLGKMFGGKK
jgi:hypothetical protein